MFLKGIFKWNILINTSRMVHWVFVRNQINIVCFGTNALPLTHHSGISSQAVVSLTFRELSNIILRKYSMPEITFSTKFQLEKARFLQYTHFERIFWSSRNVSETPPGDHLLNTWRNNNVVITSKRRHFDVITSKLRRFDTIMTSLLRNVSDGRCIPPTKGQWRGKCFQKAVEQTVEGLMKLQDEETTSYAQ